ncbi:3501_t:CDS:2, partial [Acaulospora colombiana]
MQERSRNLRSFAGTQLNRIASSNAVNKAYDLASKAREAVSQASPSSTPPPSGSGQPQTWREWALQKLPKRGPDVAGVETVYLFPAGFLLKLHISGFASSLRPPEQATRSQKAFMAIARRLAALPNLPPDIQGNVPTGVQQLPISPSTQDLLQLQGDASIDREAEELQALNAELAELPSETRETLAKDTVNPTTATMSVPLEQLKRMHSNLDLRLQPFWSSGIPNRPVILSIFCSNDSDQGETIETTSFTPLEEGRQPLFKIQTSTDAQGTFIQDISIPFETICTNPEGLSLAFGNYDTEPKAELGPILQIQPPEDEGYIRETKTIATHITIPVTNRKVRVI